MTVVADLVALRRACRPVAAWWRLYLASGSVDGAALDAALIELGNVGSVPGRLGMAIDFLLAGCPGATYVEAADAFTIVAAAGRGASLPSARGSLRA